MDFLANKEFLEIFNYISQVGTSGSTFTVIALWLIYKLNGIIRLEKNSEQLAKFEKDFRNEMRADLATLKKDVEDCHAERLQLMNINASLLADIASIKTRLSICANNPDCKSRWVSKNHQTGKEEKTKENE